MLSKNLALFALSATAAVASPFHRRAVPEFAHHRLHRSGSDGIRATGTGRLFPAGNDTNGFFAPTGSASVMPVTVTVSPLPAETGIEVVATFADAVPTSSSSCLSSSIATETSINMVTVTASAADLAATKVQAADVSAGGFYGQSSRSWGGGWGQSSAAASNAPVAGNPSTTFASVPSASNTAGASGSATAAASAAASIASSPGSSGGKRGISYNAANLVSAFGSSVSWAYNWGATAGGSPGVEFVPMMWGQNDVSSFASKVGSATHVLSFNEPDLGAQANIDPQTAAKLHKQGMASLVGKVQIGSPAVTNGATTSPPLGVNWLDQFFQACGDDCPVDFVAFHWYATADSIEYFKQHTDDIVQVAAKYGVSKVWLTEFQPEGSSAAQAAFMKEAIAYLDGNPAVERYAAFMASEGTMLSGGSLNALGSAYVGSS